MNISQKGENSKIKFSINELLRNGKNQQVFFLNNPNEALFLEPADWREMYNFSENAVLFCLSDEIYDPNDYIYTPYVNNNNLVSETNTFNQ